MKLEDIIDILSRDKEVRAEILKGLERKGVDLFEGLDNMALGDLFLSALKKRKLYADFIKYRNFIYQEVDYICRQDNPNSIKTRFKWYKRGRNFSVSHLELANYSGKKSNIRYSLSYEQIIFRDIEEELKKRGYEV